MKATEANLLDFIRRSPQFVIPIYQRTYSWTEKECRQLWDDTDKTSLISILDGAEQPQDYSLRVTENFHLFDRSIRERKDDLATVCKGLAKLMVVDIALTRDRDNPQLMFESMNSTGQELSQAGLIRNYILMGLEPVLQTKLHERYWRPMEVKFGTFAKAIDKNRYLESIQAHFLRLPSYRRFPTDEEFKREFQTKDLYNFRNRSYWLRRLENYDRREWIALNDYTIEHMLPQNPKLSPAWQTVLGSYWQRIQQTYLHTLGNLTLTAYKSEDSDRAFPEKRGLENGFKESPLKLNRGLGSIDRWDETATFWLHPRDL